MTKTSVLNYCTFQSEQKNQKKKNKKIRNMNILQQFNKFKLTYFFFKFYNEKKNEMGKLLFIFFFKLGEFKRRPKNGVLRKKRTRPSSN